MGGLLKGLKKKKFFGFKSGAVEHPARMPGVEVDSRPDVDVKGYVEPEPAGISRLLETGDSRKKLESLVPQNLLDLIKSGGGEPKVEIQRYDPLAFLDWMFRKSWKRDKLRSLLEPLTSSVPDRICLTVVDSEKHYKDPGRYFLLATFGEEARGGEKEFVVEYLRSQDPRPEDKKPSTGKSPARKDGKLFPGQFHPPLPPDIFRQFAENIFTLAEERGCSHVGLDAEHYHVYLLFKRMGFRLDADSPYFKESKEIIKRIEEETRGKSLLDKSVHAEKRHGWRVDGKMKLPHMIKEL